MSFFNANLGEPGVRKFVPKKDITFFDVDLYDHYGDYCISITVGVKGTRKGFQFFNKIDRLDQKSAVLHKIFPKFTMSFETHEE